MWDRAPLGSYSREFSLRLTGGVCHPVPTRGMAGIPISSQDGRKGLILYGAQTNPNPRVWRFYSSHQRRNEYGEATSRHVTIGYPVSAQRPTAIEKRPTHEKTMWMKSESSESYDKEVSFSQPTPFSSMSVSARLSGLVQTVTLVQGVYVLSREHSDWLISRLKFSLIELTSPTTSSILSGGLLENVDLSTFFAKVMIFDRENLF